MSQSHLRIGPEPHACVVCVVADMPPAVLPYLGRDGPNGKPTTVWAHPLCAQREYAARRVRSPIVADHEPGDGV